MKRLMNVVVQLMVIAVLCLASLSAIGQEEVVVTPMSAGEQMLESEFELLQTPTIESASKRSESVFDSPLSADVITRDMIQRSGARTIPEALRLLPGMLVYEQTAGNFDVHIRGFDNIQPGSMLQDFISTTVLVMIDYRVVYNYTQGGTYWEALPIDIIDVERIELVRGPVAALYGPNAVTGVINIITRKYESDGLHVNAQAQGALSTGDAKWKDDFTLGQRSASGRVGYKYEALSGGLSANYHSYDRYDNSIFSHYYGTRVARPQDLITTLNPPSLLTPTQIKLIYPEPELGYRTVGANAFAAYEPNKDISLVLNGGYQECRALREYFDSNYSPTVTHEVQTWFLDYRLRFHKFTFQASFLSGHQMVPGNMTELPDGTTRERYSYYLNTTDLNLDYDFVWKWLRVRPGVSFRRAQYSGLMFSEWEGNQNIGETRVIQSTSVSVGLEQTLWKRLRFIEAVRLDIYFDRTENNYYPVGSGLVVHPETKHGQPLYPSFQFAATYTPTEDHILRLSYARASKSPSMLESFFGGPPTSYGIVYMLYQGNKALDLVTFDTVELGYRARFSKQIDVSIELFGTYSRDFSNVFFHGYDPNRGLIYQYDNLNLKVWQVGTTVSFGYTSHRLQGRIFATIQQTQLEDYTIDLVRKTYDGDLFYNPLDRKNQADGTHQGTPDLFGGLYVNYQPADRWNIDVNAYYFSRRTQIHNDVLTFNPTNPLGRGLVPIRESFILNAKVSFNFWDGLTAFVNLRNLFNINQEQYIWGDPNHILCFIGLQYDL